MKFLRFAVLISVLASTLSLYYALPKTTITRCVMIQYDLTGLKVQMEGKVQDGILSQARMICIEIDKDEP